MPMSVMCKCEFDVLVCAVSVVSACVCSERDFCVASVCVSVMCEHVLCNVVCDDCNVWVYYVRCVVQSGV